MPRVSNSGEALREEFREFSGQGIALKAEHKMCNYGIARIGFGLGVRIHLL